MTGQLGETPRRQGTTDGTPEIALWRSVITQAIRDATSNPRPPAKSAKRRDDVISRFNQNRVYQAQARAWLCGFSQDFQEVCHMAQLEPRAVQEAAYDLRDKGWPRVYRDEDRVI